MKKKKNRNKEKISCVECGSKDVVKKGKRKTKLALKQIYKCKDCSKRFTLEQLRNKTYPAKIVMRAVSDYNLGHNLEKTSKLINKKYKTKISPKTIYAWLKEFNNICTYNRIRKKSVLLFKPNKVILKKVFYHQQPYKFQYHRAKAEFFINEYFSGLGHYLSNIVYIDNELFENSNRGSDVKLDFDFDKIEINEKKNYACELAKLAWGMTNDNRKRHDILQSFMLVNDSCTVACEVPVYLLADEIKYYKFINKKTKGLKNKNKLNTLTGHIDLVQLKFGLIYVLDFKPDASKEKLEKVMSQLFVYAFALSKRTGIWLRNLRCAWFDSDNYYEFNPNEIILAVDPKMPEWKKKEFLSDDKARKYYTSRAFQKIRGGKDIVKKNGLHSKRFNNQNSIEKLSLKNKPLLKQRKSKIQGQSKSKICVDLKTLFSNNSIEKNQLNEKLSALENVLFSAQSAAGLDKQISDFRDNLPKISDKRVSDFGNVGLGFENWFGSWILEIVELVFGGFEAGDNMFCLKEVENGC